MNKILFIPILLLLSIGLYSQPRKKEIQNLQFGFKAGAVYSKINGLDKVLVSETYYSGYTFKNNFMWGFTGGAYINYRFEESISGIYSEISYSRLGTLLRYSDVENFTYDFTLKYDFVNWELFYKAYIWEGLHIGLGPRLGFNLTPDALYYVSNGEDLYGPDIRRQQDLRDVLKGRSNFSLGITLGFEFINGLSIDARYYHGLSDLMETMVNIHHFIEVKNPGRTFQFTLGYALPYNMKFHK